MITEPCIPLTMKNMGHGCPLSGAELIAKLMPVRVVLPCALMGNTNGLPDEPEAEPGDLPGSFAISLQDAVPVNGCGIFPEVPGTAVGHPCVRTPG
jgi:hypothetical protein